MDLCSKYWNPVYDCYAISWKWYPHLVANEECHPTFSAGNVGSLKEDGKIQYLFKDLIEQPIVIDVSDLL